MLKWFKENAVSIEQAEKMSDQEASLKLVIGEYPQKTRPTLVETVYNTMKEAQEAED
jgi:hypothetical protein